MNLHGFSALGDRIHGEWSRLHFNEDAFPELAARALEAAPFGDFDLPGLLCDVQADPALVRANASPHAFGNLSMKLYEAADFHIELLVWTDSLTDIHEHSFAGALRVFEGGSLHCLYRFDEREKMGGRLRLGSARLDRAELLKEGDVRLIVPGHDGLVHSLFHLVRPSATVVVRTDPLTRFQPQYSLRPPVYALDVIGLSQDPEIRLAARGLDTLATIDWPSAVDWLLKLTGSLDFPRFVSLLDSVLRHIHGHPERHGALDAVLDAAGRRFGDIADGLGDVVKFRLQAADIGELRVRVHDPDLRFFLALLLNVPSSRRIYELIEEAHPGQSGLDTAVGWLARLFDDGVLGCSLGGDAASYLRSVLTGRTDDERLEVLKAEFDPEDVDAQRETLDAIFTRISGLPVVRPLLPICGEARSL